MEITWERVDMEAFRSDGYGTDPEVRCEHICERGRSDRWLISDGPINDNNTPISWTHSKEGDAFRIPLVPYRWGKPLDLALGISFLLGTRVSKELQGKDITRIHMVTGTPIEDFYDASVDTMLFHLGFAVQLKTQQTPDMEVAG